MRKDKICDDLKLFECRRSEECKWEGAVIVYAKNKEDAKRFANEYDAPWGGDNEYIITEIELIEGVIYDDYDR